MAAEVDWNALLDEHPIFSKAASTSDKTSLPLLTTIQRKASHDGGSSNGNNVSPSNRRQVMCMKDADMIIACGSEIRMTSLSDVKVSGGSQKTYKILHTPNLDFEINQICLSPNRKLLAVAGAYHVAIVVLPRSGYSKLVTSRVDCKSLLIGQYYHNNSSSPVSKIDWHPWGEVGSTLLVMTVDGRLREYDVSIDPDEPRKTMNLVSEKKTNGFSASDDSERDVASFTFGKGKADWGPLTLYVLMKSGDIYAICPYVPENASIPSSYLQALECFVSAKEEFVAENNGVIDESFSTIYDYQRKYINALLKQAPAGASLSSPYNLVSIHAPKSHAGEPARQGPFLLQPAPPDLKDSPCNVATDIMYLTLGSAFAEPDGEDMESSSSISSERLGALLVGFQDGRVDVYLDVEKIEAKWETQTITTGLPMFSVYETIDLGTLSQLEGMSDDAKMEILEKNNVTFYPDPIHNDTIYAYHAFGVHVLNLSPIFQHLAAAIKEENEDAVNKLMQKSANTSVQAIVNTYSVQSHKSDHVAAVAVPNDVYLSYSIFILTSSMQMVPFNLNLRTESLVPPDILQKTRDNSELPPLPPSNGPPAYTCLLTTHPLSIPPILERPLGLPTIAKLAVPKSHNIRSEIVLTPETLRYLANVSERIAGEIHEVHLAGHHIKSYADLLRQEFDRQQKRLADVLARTQALVGPRKAYVLEYEKRVQENQKVLLARMDKVLQTLIKKASPELNEHETRWFNELQRMKAQVLGVGKHDSQSLKYRVRQLSADYNRILPALKELAKKEAERKALEAEKNGGAGHSYVKAYEQLSKKESQKLSKAVKQIEALASKLEIRDLNPPSE